MSPEYNFHLKKIFTDDSEAIQFKESLKSILGLESDIVLTIKVGSLSETTEPITPTGDSWVTAQEASKIKHVSTARIRQLIAAEIIPAEKRGGAWLIQRQSLDRWTPRGQGRPTQKTS